MATILVVEDNPTNLQLVRFLLEQAGHQIVAKLNALSALEWLESHRPDLVLMDIQLPDLDGMTTTRRIKDNPKTRDLKVVALTALAMRGDDEQMLAAGCDAYISKPIRYQEFLATVNRMLGSPAAQS